MSGLRFYGWAVVIQRENGTHFLANVDKGGSAIFALRKEAWAYARALREHKMNAKTIRMTMLEGLR